MSDIERERRALAVFADVCEANAQDRAAILAARCADDAALRARVEELLEADASKGLSDAAADDFLQAAVEEAGGTNVASSALPVDQFGDYKVIRVIGEGGMGTVYEAEQAHPKRRVAIKAVRADLRTPRARRRFEYEAQVLAGLEHPGIARLYEANVRPEMRTRGYLVMEYVDGLPLDQYVKAKGLELDEKLQLFLRICEPIAYAHRMGVIHRDLKPANILVMADRQPKVLDFGVARTLEVHGSAATLTGEGQIVGTLAYMSPEQFDGRAAVDTRTDVYALGVVLHQLLTGKDPIDVGGAGLASAAHKLLTVVPAPIGKHDRRLRGDLEVIVARSLEKEPARRYASVEQLAAEIRRHLNGEPIEARGDSAAYILRRAAWRHRRWVLGFAAVLAAVSVFAIYASVQSERNNQLAITAAHARDDASSARIVAEQRAEDLRNSLYTANIAFARVSLDQREVAPLRRALDACDADLRGWEWFYLERLSDRAEQTIQPPGERNNTAVEIDPTFRFVAFGLPDGGFRVVSAADGKELFRGDLDGDKSKVAIAPDGSSMVAMSTAEITARRFPDGKQLWRMKKPGSNATDRLSANTVRFSPDGKILAASDYYGISLLNASDGSSIRRISDVDKLMTLEWMPDSNSLFIGDYSGNIRRITLEGKTITEYPGYGPVVQRLGISANGALLAAGNYLGRAMIWDVASGGLHPPRLETGGNAVRRFCFSADTSTVYIAGDDRLVRTIDVKSGALRDAYVGHGDGVLLATLSTDGKRLLSIARDNAIKIWPVPLPYPGVEVLHGPQQVAGLIFTPDSATIYAAGYDGKIRGWDRNGLLTPKVEFGEGTGHVVSLAANRNVSRIVTGTDDGNVRVWDCATHEAVSRMSCGARVSAVAFTPDDQKVLTGISTGKIQVWNAETGAAAGSLVAHPSMVQAISFHPDGHSFATGSADGMIRLWRWPEMTQILETRGDPKSVTDVEFSPDGRWLGSCGELTSPAVRDARTLNPVHKLIGGGGIRAINFSSNSRRVVTSGHDGTARIWDMNRGRELLTLRCGTAFVHRALFSPDGRTLATGDASGSIRFWSGPAESGAAIKIPTTQSATAPSTMPRNED